MKNLKTQSSDGFGKAILTLTSGAILAQILTVLASPLLTRIFSPQELGVYTLILTAESLFGSIICGRYDVSIVSESDEKKIYPLIKASLLITFALSVVATIGYGSYYFLLNEEYRMYSYAIIFIFIMLLLNGFIRIVESYNNRLKEYRVMSSVYVLRTSIQNFGSIILGLFKLGVFGLLLSHTSGMLFGLQRQSSTLKKHAPKIWKSTNNEMLEVVKIHYRQPLYSAPAIFANRFSYASIGLFIEALFGLAALGFYSISYKVLGLPLTVMSNNIGKVFYQAASREFDETGKFVKSFNKTLFIVLGISIPMVLGLYFLSPLIFEVVFGEGWSKAGVFVQILAPMFGVRLIVSSVASGLQVVKKQNYELLLQIFFVGASVISFVLTNIQESNIYDFLSYISISFSAIYILYFLVVLKYAWGLKET